MNKKIYLFTDRFPFGNAETFISPEIDFASRSDTKVCIIPSKSSQSRRPLPQGIELWGFLACSSFKNKLTAAYNTLTSTRLWTLPLQKRYPPNSAKQYRNAVGMLYRAFLFRNILIKNKKHFDPQGIFYSYWFNETVLGLSLAKRSCEYFRNIKIVSRAHGYDCFEEQRGVYFPHRELSLESLQNVFCISHKGAEYLKKRYPEYGEKFTVSYLGVTKQPKKDYIAPDDSLNVVSCSNVIPLKRCGLIFEFLNRYALSHPDKTFTWTHFGDGSEMDTLKLSVQSPAPNLRITLKGRTANDMVIAHYRENPCHLFVNLSSSEGLPVSVLEAFSIGIPALATDVGGTSEAVITGKSGFLLSLDPTYEEFEGGMDYIIGHHRGLSEGCHSIQNELYCSEKNFAAFYENLNK